MNDIGSTVAFVPVRGGSKGLPGKNIRQLGGTALYLRAVNQGIRAVGSCLVSTDIEEVLNGPKPNGCAILNKPDVLCGDDVPMDAVIHDVIEKLDLEDRTKIVILQATSPLRIDADVLAAIELYGRGQHELVLSVTNTSSEILKYGMLQGANYVPIVSSKYCFMNRQYLPNIFRPNGAIFVFSVGTFKNNKGLATENIGAIEMPPERSLDIDTLKDFNAVEAEFKKYNEQL